MEADEVEFSGRTVDDAVAKAEAQLGINRNDVDIQVLSQGRGGVFGIGAEPARIQVRRKQSEMSVPEAPASRPQAAFTPETSEEPSSTATAVATLSDEQDGERPIPRSANLAAEATEVLSKLLESMGFHTDITVQNQEDPLTLTISGENLGVLIGRRGDNLSALQFMVNLILSKGRRQWPRVVLDVEHYRARREESLRSLADRIAYRVSRNGRPFTLEAMPASDRRIIHLALRDRPDIETYSIGEGPARRVVVAPQKVERHGMDENY